MNMAAIQNIGDCGQKTIAPAGRELLRGKVAVTIHGNIGIACLFPLAYQRRKLLRIILHISILHSDQLSAHPAKPCAQSYTFALVTIMAYITIGVERFFLAEFLQYLPGAICRCIIHYYDLQVKGYL